MSKIYEALEKLHEDPFASDDDVELSESGVDRVVPKFHQRGIDVASGRSRSEVGEFSPPTDFVESEVVRINPTEVVASEATSGRRVHRKHRYTIALDDIRSVSAAIRSTASGERSRCLGLISLGVGDTGAALVRDVASYEAQLDVNGVVLVDVDRIRVSQHEYFGLGDDYANFDQARETGDWKTAVESSVTEGVDLVCFSEVGDNFRQATDTATYQSFVDYCRSSYALSLFDLPADGPDSETHRLGALLDSVVILCSRKIDATVVNRYIEDLTTSGVKVLGVIHTT